MASADLRAELECSVCLDIYTDPVTLKCGHNFCRDCIDRVLHTQEGSGGHSCPECREKFQERPALQRNITLRNIVESFLSAQPDPEESGVLCTYCVDSPVPAVRSCLLCEVSLCDKHLRVHKKSPEHILCDPTLSTESRKCSVHKKILEYYCTEDDICVCMSCCLIGGHTGHKMESLDEASEKKKETLRNILQKLLTQREETEERVQSLQEHRRKVEEIAAGDTERVSALIRELRRRLEDLEKKVLSEISGRAERVSISVMEKIRELEIKKDELKMRDIEELCNMTDPLTVLQESDTGDLCDTEDGDDEDRERHDRLLRDGGGLDVAGLSHTLHTGLSDIITEVNVSFYIQEAEDILLDVSTAHNYLQISHDRKTVSRSEIDQNHPKTPQRFQCPQVLGSRSFSSGRHYWEVDVGGSDEWRVGMCYPSIGRRGGVQSLIGRNNKSWGLVRDGNQYLVIHDSNQILLPPNISSTRVGIYLDYEAGRISFYDLCDPIRHLHTFTTTFTEPLHAGLRVGRGSIKICGGTRELDLVVRNVLVFVELGGLIGDFTHSDGRGLNLERSTRDAMRPRGQCIVLPVKVHPGCLVYDGSCDWPSTQLTMILADHRHTPGLRFCLQAGI
ncbi:PREDICTED: probable E3 ubiquitin-protein ligase TRIML1 [Nanorana parkeri]|uniref:probable E3 ubiquitin-protein ligase TRIML1 n=1 Tax=Nanorana parkeri TaxID=125878 RepID=UPI000853F1CF|nr:PREDICTED: probable E3 ubiquitin-protein ligase TRIML1 [Nanorana parkeri]